MVVHAQPEDRTLQMNQSVPRGCSSEANEVIKLQERNFCKSLSKSGGDGLDMSPLIQNYMLHAGVGVHP